MKKRIFTFLICISTVALIFDSPIMSSPPSWIATCEISNGVRIMGDVSKTIFETIRDNVRTNGLSNMITYTAGQNSGKGMAYNFGTTPLPKWGYILIKSGTYSMPITSIATGVTFNYCIFITDQSGTPVPKGRIYFNDIEKPYSSKALIVMDAYFFDTTNLSATTMIELFCYNDGTTPSMMISLILTPYRIRTLVQETSDLYEVSSFINSGANYYTVAYAAKKTGSNYSIALQGGGSANTPANNASAYYGYFTSVSNGTLVNSYITTNSDANYATMETIESIYASMLSTGTSGLLPFFVLDGTTGVGGLSQLGISLANYPNP